MHLDTKLSSLPFRNRWSRVHPGEKLLASSGCLLLALTSPTGGWIAGIVCSGATILGAGIPSRAWWKFCRAPLAFTVLSLTTLSLDYGDQGIRLQPDRAMWASVFARSMGAAGAAGMLALTTPLDHVFPMLTHLGMPPAFGDLLVATYRFIFTTFSNLGRMVEALERRNVQGGWRATLRAVSMLMGSLLVRSLRHAARKEEAYSWRASMASRDEVILPGTWRPARPAVVASLATAFLVAWTALLWSHV